MKLGWRILGCIVLGALFLILLVMATMGLWNWLVPVLFSGPIITFWQALGLLVLSKILFSGIGGKHWHHKNENGGHQWKNKFYEKISNLTPEERDSLKQKMQEKWCNRGIKDSTEKQNDPTK